MRMRRETKGVIKKMRREVAKEEENEEGGTGRNTGLWKKGSEGE